MLMCSQPASNVLSVVRDISEGVASDGQIVWGRVPLTRWQMDIIGPMPNSEVYCDGVNGVDIMMGLLTAYPAHRPDQ